MAVFQLAKLVEFTIRTYKYINDLVDESKDILAYIENNHTHMYLCVYKCITKLKNK